MFRSAAITKMPTEGPLEVIQASKDGCRTAMTARGGGIHKNTIGFYMTHDLVMNPLYRQVYAASYIWCFQKINGSEAFATIDADLDNSFAEVFNWRADTSSMVRFHADNSPPAYWALGSKGVDMGWGSEGVTNMFGFFGTPKFN